MGSVMGASNPEVSWVPCATQDGFEFLNPPNPEAVCTGEERITAMTLKPKPNANNLIQCPR